MILIIHPQDPTTKALGRIKNHLFCEFPEDVKIFNVHANEESHKECIKVIKNCTCDDLVIYLGHGRGDSLYGAMGNSFESKMFVDSRTIEETPEEFFFEDKLINETNYGIFKGKKLICVACHSKELGKKLRGCGISSFIGFGELPSTKGEYKEYNGIISQKVVDIVKGDINLFIKRSIPFSIRNNLDFYHCYKLLQFSMAKVIAHTLSSKSRFKNQIAGQLFKVMNGITYFGSDIVYKTH